MKLKIAGNLRGGSERAIVYYKDSLCPAQTATQYKDPIKVLLMTEKEILQLGNIMPTTTRDNPNQGRVYDIKGIAPTITDVSGGGGRQPMIVTENKIRKLTPLECWRLMGFSDADFKKAQAKNSNTQLYKQAGNSIVKNVLVAVFGQMIPGKENIYKNIRADGAANRPTRAGKVET